jgi:type VI protein secretion system component VasK
VSSIAAGILLWLLQRFVPNRALRAFQVVAIIVLVLSFGLPIGLDQPVEGQLSLVAMHILVGAVIIATMTWVATKPTEEAEASETSGQESRGTD